MEKKNTSLNSFDEHKEENELWDLILLTSSDLKPAVTSHEADSVELDPVSGECPDVADVDHIDYANFDSNDLKIDEVPKDSRLANEPVTIILSDSDEETSEKPQNFDSGTNRKKIHIKFTKQPRHMKDEDQLKKSKSIRDHNEATKGKDADTAILPNLEKLQETLEADYTMNAKSQHAQEGEKVALQTKPVKLSVVCKHWRRKGYCLLEDECRYMHSLEQPTEGEKVALQTKPVKLPVVCKHWQGKGYCLLEDECRYMHSLEQPTVGESSRDTEVEPSDMTVLHMKRKLSDPDPCDTKAKKTAACIRSEFEKPKDTCHYRQSLSEAKCVTPATIYPLANNCDFIHAAVLRPVRTRPCSHFLNGNCSLGDRCTFAHGTSAESAAMTETGTESTPADIKPPKKDYQFSLIPCRYFIIGCCALGDGCKFSHGANQVPGVAKSRLTSQPIGQQGITQQKDKCKKKSISVKNRFVPAEQTNNHFVERIKSLRHEQEIRDRYVDVTSLREISYGKAMPESIVRFMQKAGKYKEGVGLVIKTYKLPSNCIGLKPPIMNANAWAHLTRESRASDEMLQDVERWLVSGIIPLVKQINLFGKSLEIMESVYRNTTDALHVIAFVCSNLSIKRRLLMRNALQEKYSILCRRRQPVSELLFGDSVPNDLQAVEAGTFKIPFKELELRDRNNDDPESKDFVRTCFVNLSFTEEEVDDNVANIINMACVNDGDVSDLREKYKIPPNCKEIIPPMINPEIWSLVSRSGLELDYRLQDVHLSIAEAMVPLMLMLQSVYEQRYNESETLTLLTDALLLLGNSTYQLNKVRMDAMRRSLPEQVHGYCGFFWPGADHISLET